MILCVAWGSTAQFSIGLEVQARSDGYLASRTRLAIGAGTLYLSRKLRKTGRIHSERHAKAQLDIEDHSYRLMISS